jgi:tetratricopeptide (TPR) repeat protein
VAALDDWGTIKKRRPAGSEEPARVVARLADDDPWRQQLRDPKVRKDRAALERLAEAEGVLAQPPSDLLWLSGALDAVQGRVAAERLLRRAQQRLPADFWINFVLAGCLYEEPATRAEAIGFLRAALALRPHSHVVYNNLGVVLEDQNKLAEAEAAYRKAIELKPDSAEAYHNLGNTLRGQNKLAEAEAAYRKAIELKPDYAEVYYNSLGNDLRDQKKLAEAEAAFRKAIELKPAYAEAHCNLGIVLSEQVKPVEAVAAYRKAIELKPDLADAHYCLGIALQAQGKLAEAVAVYRKAIEVKPDLAEAHCNLGQLLVSQGLFAEALVHRRRGHELGSQRPGWTYRSAQRVKESERLVELDAKLSRVLKGEAQPTDVGERLALAELCELPCKSLYAAAAGFYGAAFAAQPELADDLQGQPRYNAACAAVLAGCGQGKDAGGLDDKDWARLRKQALDWLKADLAAWRGVLEKDKEALLVSQQMRHWLGDPDFNGVRGAEALAKLPQAERGGWQHLWDEVAALRQRAQQKEK